ncbi:MAG: hypothetical protein ACR2IP_00975 [Solirubrobacteraceae bacterium]
MGRLADLVIEWLMRPRVRRARRWSFVATVPVSLLVAHVYGVHEGVAVVAARLALSGSVAIAAWRLGGDRGEALRDLLMHPRLRAFGRAEFDIVTALPRLLLAHVLNARRGGGSGRAGLRYTRGTFGLALALAFTPVVVSEALVAHLLLGGGPEAWVSTALHAYMLIWMWSFALGPRCYPHRIGARTAVLRAGPMYRVLVPRSAILSATEHRERLTGRHGLLERDGDAVMLPVRGRVEVWLELSEPVRVQRPLHEPLYACRLAVASDDPQALIEQLLAPVPRARPTRDLHAVDAGLGLLAAFDLAGLARDAAQPG